MSNKKPMSPPSSHLTEQPLLHTAKNLPSPPPCILINSTPFLHSLSLHIKAMEWHAWLSRSGLEPGLVYDYSLVFSGNELEKDDIRHFNHEFLQSMGISVAKHRLEILKLARKEMDNSPRPISRLLAAIHRTKKCIAKYISSILHRDNSAIVVVPRPSYYGMQQSAAIMKRSKKQAQIKRRMLLLTDGRPAKNPSMRSGTRNTCPAFCDENEKAGGNCGDGYWGSEEIRWDSMFQDLKPT